jgi:hypothetical protein
MRDMQRWFQPPGMACLLHLNLDAGGRIRGRREKHIMAKNLRLLSVLLVCIFCVLRAETKPAKTGQPGIVNLGHGASAVLWREPGDANSIDLRYGSGGEERQPRGPFTFVQEDLEGSNPKLDIRGQDGVKWKVKLGAEARPEVAASRFVWAAGYFTTDDYFLADLRVQDLPRLHRGQDLVASDGTLHNVRLKRSFAGQEKLGVWKWSSNPFVGTREFNGLRVLMALMNNWDLKDSNNAYYEKKPKEGSTGIEHTYLISDLGASFGTTGFVMSTEASRGNLEAYRQSKFISNMTPDYVDFGAPGRPTLVEAINVPVFLHRVDMRWIGRRINRADARWMGQVLGRLSPAQIRDAFTAAGYSQEDAREFAAVVQGRIAELKAL